MTQRSPNHKTVVIVGELLLSAVGLREGNQVVAVLEAYYKILYHYGEGSFIMTTRSSVLSTLGLALPHRGLHHV
jgi:hypothetical protein